MRITRLHRYYRYYVLVILIFLSGCEVALYSDLNERQANQMLSILLSENIDATKSSLGKGRYSVLVQKSELADAVNYLNAEGIPGEQYADMQEMYKKEGLISSPMEERVRYMYSLSQSIAETLTNIDGVLVARVHVAVPETDKFTGKIRPTSASVFIKYQEGFELVGTRSEIKRIVESSIEGLSYQRIAVYFSPSKRSNRVTSEEKIVKYGSLEIAESSVGQIKYISAFLVFVFFIMSLTTIRLVIKGDALKRIFMRVKRIRLKNINSIMPSSLKKGSTKSINDESSTSSLGG